MLKLLGSKCLIVNICIYPELAKDLQKDNQHYLLKLLTHFLWIIRLQIGWHLRNHFPQRDAHDIIRSKWFCPKQSSCFIPFCVITFFFHEEFIFSNFCLFIFMGINHQGLPVYEVVTACQKWCILYPVVLQVLSSGSQAIVMYLERLSQQSWVFTQRHFRNNH